MTKLSSFDSPLHSIQLSFEATRKFAFLFYEGNALLARAAEHGSIMHHLSRYAGIKTSSNINHSDPVLFEWRRVMPESATHDEVVLFTPNLILRLTESTSATRYGAITIAQLREISMEEILSYSRIYPNFGEFVEHRYLSLWFRVGKLSGGRFSFS